MRFTFSALSTTAILAMSAGGAAAQAVSCGGIGDAGQWMGGSPEASDISVSDGPLALLGLAVPEGGDMVGLFSLSEAMDIRAEAQPAVGGDTVIEVYNEAGDLIVIDDDSGGSLASRAETFMEPGNYCALVRGWAGRDVVADVQIGRLEHTEITEGLGGGFGGGFEGGFGGGFVGVEACTADTQAIILGTGPIDGQLSDGIVATNSVTAAPYYRFTLDSPQPVTIRADNPSSDPYIYIFNGAGTLIAENDDFQSLNSRIDFTTPLEAGTYCIGMRSLRDDNLPITVSVAGYDAAAALRELYDMGDAAPPNDGSYPITDMGELAGRSVLDVAVSGDTAQWISFDIPVGGFVVIDAIEVTNSDPVIILYNDLGQQLAFNDDFGGSFNSQISSQVQPGTYLLAIRQFSDSYDGIIRIGTQRYVPAP